MPDRAATVALLGVVKPTARPKVVIVPRCRRPETTATLVSRHERSLAAADALGRALADLELRDRRRL